jgi:hypothetical protein
MTTYDQIQLADNEWGNQIMREVAEQWFARHPDCAFLEVREHAGWWLAFARTPYPGSTGHECIGSANDMACFRPDRPRPTVQSGQRRRREVIRPDLKEVSSLAQLQPETAYA